MNGRKDRKLERLKKRLKKAKKKWFKEAIKEIDAEFQAISSEAMREETIGRKLGITEERENYILRLVAKAINESSRKHEVIIALKKENLKSNELLLAIFYAGFLIAEYLAFLQKVMFSRNAQELTERIRFLEREAIKKISEKKFSSIRRPEELFAS
ncbi:hypothetical protein J7K03_02680 [bacterium]|nr:hypothetical protein [bacterium]